jgi:methylthioribose-1-phosphate isomerase
MTDEPFDPTEPPADTALNGGRNLAPDGAQDGADLERRLFFRRFASDVFQAAAAVVGTAAALQRSSAEAASVILDPEHAAGILEPVVTLGEPPPPRGFRTPFRYAPDDDGTLLLIDQRRLPFDLVEHPIRSAAEATWAIKNMVVRGAPAIGQVAAIGLALTAHHARKAKPFARRAMIRGGASALKQSRPTAVNLAWAVDRILARYEAVGDLDDDGDMIADALRAEADAIVLETTTNHGRLADFGLAEMPAPDDRPLRILTHCNTGPLACGQFGTALGVVQALHHQGRELKVWVDETRPYLQGARLTTWELAQAGVPHTLIADVAAGHLLARGEVDVVLVGADRIAGNGDTANKIGTYTLAVLAALHGVPFYVCAPLNSVDLATTSGADIDIEEREPDEIVRVHGQPIAPDGTDALNPAFDVTPADLITAIVTEEGVLRPPFALSLVNAVERARARQAANASTADEAAAGSPRAVSAGQKSSDTGSASASPADGPTPEAVGS